MEEIGFLVLCGECDSDAEAHIAGEALPLWLDAAGAPRFGRLVPVGTLAAAAIVAGCQLASASVVAVSGRRAAVRLSVLAQPDAPTSGSHHALALVTSHVRDDWAAPPPPRSALEALSPCGAVGCVHSCAAGPPQLASSLAKLLTDLRPPRCGAAASPTAKLSAVHPSPADLPTSCLDAILLKLPSRDLRAVASTCCSLRERCASLAPGLHVTLHAHQRDALAWMRSREGSPRPFPPPLHRELVTRSGARLWAHALTGQITRAAPPSLVDCRGGMLCDEPGLGAFDSPVRLFARNKSYVSSSHACRFATRQVADGHRAVLRHSRHLCLAAGRVLRAERRGRRTMARGARGRSRPRSARGRPHTSWRRRQSFARAARLAAAERRGGGRVCAARAPRLVGRTPPPRRLRIDGRRQPAAGRAVAAARGVAVAAQAGARAGGRRARSGRHAVAPWLGCAAPRLCLFWSRCRRVTC